MHFKKILTQTLLISSFCTISLPLTTQAEDNQTSIHQSNSFFEYHNRYRFFMSKNPTNPLIFKFKAYPSGDWVGQYFESNSPLKTHRFKGELIDNQLFFSLFEPNENQDTNLTLSAFESGLTGYFSDQNNSASADISLKPIQASDFLLSSSALTILADRDLYDALKQEFYPLIELRKEVIHELPVTWYHSKFHDTISFFKFSGGISAAILPKINTELELNYRENLIAAELFEYPSIDSKSTLTFKSDAILSIQNKLLLKNEKNESFSTIEGLNFDLNTGELIKLQELLSFQNGEEMGEWVLGYLTENNYDILSNPPSECPELGESLIWSEGYVDWHLSPEGIHLTPYVSYPCVVDVVLPFAVITERKVGL